MTVKSLKILVRMTFPDGRVTRLHDGSGPFVDGDGDLWIGASLSEGLDEIEHAMNGEASTLALGISGLAGEASGLAFEELEAGNVIDGVVELLLQDLDGFDQPVDDPTVKFTGTIDNMPLSDAASDNGVVSGITLEVSNRFTLRRLISGSVLSDVDQKARSELLNPGAPPDRFCERITGLSDKSIRWPRYS